jgi:hypothetical protein
MSQAARRKVSTWRSHQSSWFQLVKFRLTSLRSRMQAKAVAPER